MVLQLPFIQRVMIVIALFSVQSLAGASAQETGLGFVFYKTQLTFKVNGDVAIDGEFTLRSGEEISFRKTSKPNIAFEMTAYNNSILDERGRILGADRAVWRKGDVFAFKIYRLNKNIPGASVWKLVATPVMMVKEGEASTLQLFDQGDVINLGLKYERLDAASFNAGLKNKVQ